MSNSQAVVSTLETRILSSTSILRITKNQNGGIEEAYIQTPFVMRGFTTKDIKDANQVLASTTGKLAPAGH